MNLDYLKFHGLTVIESVYLTVDGTPYEEARSWRERLFSLPWRPWVRTRTVTPKIPHPGGLRLNDTILLMHPATVVKLREALRNTEKRDFHG